MKVMKPWWRPVSENVWLVSQAGHQVYNKAGTMDRKNTHTKDTSVFGGRREAIIT